MGWIHSWTLNIASTLLQDLSTLVSYVLFLGCSLAGQHQQQVLSCRKEIAFCICCRVFQNLRIFCGSGAQVGHGCYRLSSIPRYGFELGATVGGVSWRWRSAYRRLRLSGALNVVKHGWPGSAPQPCVRKKGCKFGSHLERHVKCGGCMQWQDGHIMKHMNRCHPLCHFSACASERPWIQIWWYAWIRPSRPSRPMSTSPLHTQLNSHKLVAWWLLPISSDHLWNIFKLC